VTEVDWLTAPEPHPIFLQTTPYFSERKARLFAVACCRRIWSLLIDDRSRRAVEVAEVFADDPRLAQELTVAYYAANVALLATDPLEECYHAAASLANAVAYASARHGCESTRLAATAVADTVADARIDLVAYKTARAEELAAQAVLLRDIFGNPFQPPLIADPSWLTTSVVALAQAAYEHRQLPGGELDPARLAVLCDALLDAGCPAEHELLLHLRGPGVHVRGCHAVNIILDRQ